MAIGAFSTQPIDYRSRLINTNGTPYTGNLPTNLGGTLPIGSRVPAPMPTSRIPIPTTVIGDPIIKMPAFVPPILIAGGGAGAPPTTPQAPTVSSPADQSTPGSTGTSDMSRLIDLIGSSFASQEVGGNVAPVSFAAENTGDAGAGGGSNPMVPIILALVVIAGVYFYMKRKGK